MSSYRIQFKSGRSFVFEMGDTPFEQIAAGVANNPDGFLAIEDERSVINICEIESIQPAQSGGQEADAAQRDRQELRTGLVDSLTSTR